MGIVRCTCSTCVAGRNGGVKMIELGALLGAIAWAHVALAGDNAVDDGLVFRLTLIPFLGALWGAAVAAVIHFAADESFRDSILAYADKA